MNNKSFTLIELLVVIAIIGVLSAIVITSISGAITKSRIVRLQVFSDSIRAQLSDSLVSYWSFNEGTGTTAYDQWEGNNGTLGGDPEWKSGGECVSGKCLEFDGNDYVNCGNKDSLSPDYITVEAWVKRLEGGEVIVAYGWCGSVGEGYKLYSYSSKIRFLIYCETGSEITTTGVDWRTDEWLHVVGTYDGSNKKVYLNGVIIQNIPKSIGIIKYPEVLSVGVGAQHIDTAPESFFNGLIDEVRIYNSAVSITQIQSQYLAGLDKLLSNGAISKSEYNQRIKELSRSLVNE